LTIEDEGVQLQLTATAPPAACPCCAVPSASVHSRYQRRLADLPWGSRGVRLQLTVRKFRCRNRTCERRIFTERLPELVAAYGRNPHRLVTALRAIGMALGGEAGTRVAARLQLPTSPSTLLRLVRAAPMPQAPALQAVGIDEWAWRRGHRYGTILVNLADHRVIDLLPDRSATSVAAWLAQHPTITVVCRDRSDLYAAGSCTGGRSLPSRPQPPPSLGSLPPRPPPGTPRRRRQQGDSAHADGGLYPSHAQVPGPAPRLQTCAAAGGGRTTAPARPLGRHL
jgi:transposase